MALSTTPAKKEQAKEEVKAPAEHVAEAPKAPEVKIDPAIIGSKSDDLIYMGVIVDPTQKDVKTIGSKEDGTLQTLEGHVVVGYRFKTKKAIDKVPAFGLNPNDKDFATSIGTLGRTVKAKAGEELFLTMVETGALLLQPEYNGKVTGRDEGGNGIDVSISVRRKTRGGATGAANNIPRVSIRSTKRGISAYTDPVDAFKATQETSETGVVRYRRTPITEGPLAKFAPMAKNTAGRVSSSKSPAGETLNSNAGAFLNAVGMKL